MMKLKKHPISCKFFAAVPKMDTKKMWELSAAFIAFTVVSLVSIEIMYYLMGYPLDIDIEGHWFLSTIGFLVGALVASAVYLILKR